MPDRATEFSILLRLAHQEALTGDKCAFETPEQNSILNGAPYRSFRESVALEERRRQGTFFSGPELSREAASLLRSELPDNALVLDPTCGLGDLLIAYAEKLPICVDLDQTLELWGRCLAGIELRPDLINMTKTRLVMLARHRGKFTEPLDNIENKFPMIIVGNMFDQEDLIKKADGFLFNPPFGQTSDHSEIDWGQGLVNSAALCLNTLIKFRRSKTPISAILPEVLRCGSRYERFRVQLTEAGLRGAFFSKGRFDTWTDVDVFVTLITETSPVELWISESSETEKCIGDLFDVRVGTVVPHRHPQLGKWYPFVCAKTVPPLATNYLPRKNRRFKGTVFTPPFVVVRRTSSPSDKMRAVGAIVVGDKPVAVENHLIVITPKDGSVLSCEQLLSQLREDRTTQYLNRAIRCRHLTTGAVMSIPWISFDD